MLTDGPRGLERIAAAFDPGKPRLCVLDASDTLTLLDPERLSVLRR